MKSAIYGRMKIGRCLTAEEVDAHRSVVGVGEDPRYFGCSADVLPLLDRKCSGQVQCEVRMSDISAENVKPCFPGLTVYLEVSYTCITSKRRIHKISRHFALSNKAHTTKSLVYYSQRPFRKFRKLLAY